jgi:hypothetical protein
MATIRCVMTGFSPSFSRNCTLRQLHPQPPRPRPAARVRTLRVVFLFSEKKRNIALSSPLPVPHEARLLPIPQLGILVTPPVPPVVNQSSYGQADSRCPRPAAVAAWICHPLQRALRYLIRVTRRLARRTRRRSASICGCRGVSRTHGQPWDAGAHGVVTPCSWEGAVNPSGRGRKGRGVVVAAALNSTTGGGLAPHDRWRPNSPLLTAALSCSPRPMTALLPRRRPCSRVHGGIRTSAGRCSLVAVAAMPGMVRSSAYGGSSVVGLDLAPGWREVATAEWTQG